MRSKHLCFSESAVAGFSKIEYNSVTEPVITGTLCAPPSNLPFSSGKTRPIAFAAPAVYLVLASRVTEVVISSELKASVKTPSICAWTSEARLSRKLITSIKFITGSV